MKKKTRTVAIGIILASSLIFVSAVENKEWKAPVSADKLTNPVANMEEETKSGKKLYKQMCAICHGNQGKGDGMAGSNLNPRPSDFTTDKVQNQTDGAIYWKMTEGRAPMASYKSSLKEKQRWQLVNYIRTFKK